MKNTQKEINLENVEKRINRQIEKNNNKIENNQIIVIKKTIISDTETNIKKEICNYPKTILEKLQKLDLNKTVDFAKYNHVERVTKYNHKLNM